MLRVNGFYGHVRSNDLRSLAMFAGFALAFQIVAAVALFLPLVFLDFRHLPFVSLGYLERYAPIVFVLGVALFAHRFLRHVASVRASVAFVDVDRRTDSRLVNIVEATAIAAGLPTPKVGLIETSALNAFACGLTASSAVVVVTRGLLDSLDDDELAAVVAHEIAHIRNGDIRLLAAANVLMEMLLLVQRRNPLGRVGWKRALILVFMPALLLLFGAAGFLTRIAFTVARVSRLLISSSREFVADAEAVRLTHNPAALVSALRRIEGRSAVPGLAPQADAMMIDGAVDGPFASHPTVAERIAALTRFAGAWAEDVSARKDTRPAPRREGVPTAWVRAAAEPAPPAPAAAGPARFLFQRVNTGVTRNLFGLTPGAKRVFGVGFALFVCAWGWALLSPAKPVKRVESNAWQAAAARHLKEPFGAVSAAGDAAGPASRARAEVQRLSRLDPVEARCFATERYAVGDRGLRRLRDPDPALVAAYLRNQDAGSSDVVLERYLALKERSTRQIAEAVGGELDARLLAYVRTRKTMLWVLHRFFDDAGLRLMQQHYDGPADRAALALLEGRLADGALRVGGKLAREMELLVSAPQDFVPCLARAEAAERVAKPTR